MLRVKQAFLALGLAALLIPAVPRQLQSQEVCTGISVDLIVVEWYIEYCEDVGGDDGGSCEDGSGCGTGGGGGGGF